MPTLRTNRSQSSGAQPMRYWRTISPSRPRPRRYLRASAASGEESRRSWYQTTAASIASTRVFLRDRPSPSPWVV